MNIALFLVCAFILIFLTLLGMVSLLIVAGWLIDRYGDKGLILAMAYWAFAILSILSGWFLFLSSIGGL